MNIDRVQILDCTLRDGGYVNDWQFGDEVGQNIVRNLSKTGVDFIELGFIRLDEYRKDKMQFSEVSQITELFRPLEQKLAAMVEIGYGYPSSRFPIKDDSTVDLVRLIIWKRSISEGVQYCKELIDKGYEVAIQATRTDQYSFDEFESLMKSFNAVKPYAVYIVDTFGLFTKEMLLKYAEIADKYLQHGIRIGYHAHNNMQQAYGNAIAFMERDWNHDIIIDASVMGIGRGAGNLPIELLMNHLNNNGGAYNLEPVFEVSEQYLKPIYNKTPWGYSIPYFLSAKNGCNPTYVEYLKKKGLGINEIETVFESMRKQGIGIRFDVKSCDELIKNLRD